MNSEQVNFVRHGGWRLFSLLRLPCKKGETRIKGSIKHLRSIPDPQGGFHCPLGEHNGHYLSLWEPSVP